MRSALAHGANGVIWVTLRETGGYAGTHRGTNGLIQAAARRWPLPIIADWNAYSAGRPWLGSDGRHLDAAGPAALASFLQPFIFRAAALGPKRR